MYRLRFLDPARKSLKRLDRAVAHRIFQKVDWLTKNADDMHAEGLHGKLAGLMKLREGDYRILYEIVKDEQVIVIHAIGHRSEIYQ